VDGNRDEFADVFKVPPAGWWTIVTGTWHQMQRHHLSALAGGAAYYALTSIFPTLTAIVSIYGLIADPVMVENQLGNMAGILPPEVVKLLAGWLQSLLQGSTRHFGIALVVSVLFSTWSAWSATSMLMTAVNICYGDEERRSFWRFSLEALFITGGLALVGAAGLILLAVPPIIENLVPMPDAIKTAVSLLRWPILTLLAIGALAIIYRYGPTERPKSWAWISWGATFATGFWLIGSAAFSFYVSAFGSYDRTYGSLGAVVVLLLWFYISAYVILVGAELNAEIERIGEGRRPSAERAGTG
jgi:membrane protein